MTTRNFENGKVKCLECGKKIVLNETFIVGIDRTGKEYVYCAEHGKKLKKKNVIAA